MKKLWKIKTWYGIMALFIALLVLPGAAWAYKPVVKTVPWVATNPLIPHDVISGKATTLKGTCDVQAANFQYAWDFGDGTPVATGTVTNRYAIEATHTYTGTVGLLYTARLTVEDTGTHETSSKEYYVVIRDNELPAQVNIAIDEGLWYIHKTQHRYSSGGLDYGDWLSGSGYTISGYQAVSVANINAFEVQGHQEGGNPDNPYTETVQRGMRSLFTWLQAFAITPQTNPLGTFNPDSNGNGLGVQAPQVYPPYVGGMYMATIVASATPNAITTTGPANIIGRSYAAIVQDMVDAYAWGQYDSNPLGGGWRYNWGNAPDNSICQWAAIGMLAAEREWHLTVPQIVKDWNRVWLAYSQAPNGSFGYTNQSPIWGPYATHPSGMVQMVMDGIHRGNAGSPNWDMAETFIRDNFCNTGGAYYAIRDYYYGMFSFVKAMELYDANGDGVAEPIIMLQSQTPGVAPLDWYGAELSKGDPCDGVARTLVNDQAAAGYWWGHNNSGDQYPFETAWAVIMLQPTGCPFCTVPVAVAEAIPNPGVVNGLITLNGSGSYHLNSARHIVSWEWDLNNDGIFEASGPVITASWPALGDYPVRLRVCDDGDPVLCAETVVTVRITIPPVEPTANAGGPYFFCPNISKWFLDGRGSVNPDDGIHLNGYPGDFIREYAWDLDGDNDFADAFGPTPEVTAYFTGKGPGSYNVQLRVTDNTAISWGPSYSDLSDTDLAQVTVLGATDPACSCINDLTARIKDGKVQLVWTDTGATGYSIYRGTVSGGPYTKIGYTTSRYSTYLDSQVVNGTTYYYVVREVALDENEVCQSNQVSATPRRR